MPVMFLTAEQEAQYGRYPGDPSPAQLAQYFYLDDADRDWLSTLRHDASRWGCAVQLGTVRFLGTFVNDGAQIPPTVTSYVAAQLGLREMSNLVAYFQSRLHWHHQQRLIAQYHYHPFDQQSVHWRLVRWLYGRAWMAAERPSVLFDQATAYLIDHKILLPGVTTLARLVAQVRDRAQTRLWHRLAALPDPTQRSRLEALLQVETSTRQTTLDRLRHPPTRVSKKGFNEACQRLTLLQVFDAATWNLRNVPMARIEALARYAATARAQAVARMPVERRIATLVAFVVVWTRTAQDDLVDLFDRFLADLWGKATRQTVQRRLRTLHGLDRAARLCRDACAIVLQEETPDSAVRTTIFDQIAKSSLQAAMTTIEQLTQSPVSTVEQQIIPTVYPALRMLVALWLQHLVWKSTPAGQADHDRWEFLKTHWGQPLRAWREAPLTGITPPWRVAVVNAANHIVPKAYTVWTLHHLWEALRRHDIYVPGSTCYGDPRAQLLQDSAWEAARPHVLRTLGWTEDPDQTLEPLARALDTAYRETTARWDANPAVRIESGVVRDRLVLSPLDRLEDPPSLRTLRRQVAALLPHPTLPDLLLEVQRWTRFADAFTHISQGGERIKDLPLSVCAVLLTQACNIGLDPVIHHGIPALERDRLTWVAQNYVRADTLVAANAALVEFHARLPMVRYWGAGEVASADGMRFAVPVQTVHAGYNPKYFGMGRGVTYYNFTSDQFSGFHALVIPGTIRDSLFLLEGLLEQTTTLRPHEIMTDTAGYSDLIFGLFGLLGYQFSPRLADIGESRFWRMDVDADYGVLNGLARQRIRTDLIRRHWKDMLRVAGSLKWGAVNATALIQTLQHGGRPTLLGRAIGELGRIYKTRYLLAYLDDEGYRRRILTQLNRGEARHSLARAVFYGKRGELHQAYREGQEDQLHALGLVVNAIVLWNTQYMGVTLNALRERGQALDETECARISPLVHDHITMLGHYSFDVPKPVAEGRLRPLTLGPDDA